MDDYKDGNSGKISSLSQDIIEKLTHAKYDGVKIYEDDKVLSKLATYPDYVSRAMSQRISDKNSPLEYDKIVLDKWGKKDSETKRFVETPEMVFYRAAMLAADGLRKNDPSLNYESALESIFNKFVNREFFPNTPYMANGGHKLLADYIKKRLPADSNSELINELEQQKKIKEQLFACFVLDIYDSRESIFKTMTEAAEIQAHLGGTGFNFSNLRPANEMIHGTGGATDGPIAFMATYSQVLGKTMNQAGKREGANMFMLDWNHPDIMRFIYSKREDGEISAANISVAIDRPFIEAVKADGDNGFYPLKNPHYNPENRPHIPKHYSVEQLKESLEITRINKKAKASLLLADNGVDVLSPWLQEGMSEEYRKIGKIENGIVYLDAKKVFRHLAYSAWFNGEPGAIITGHINDHNPTHPEHYRNFLIEQKDPEAVKIVDRLRQNNQSASLENIIDQFLWLRDEDGRLVNLPIGVGVMRATNPCGEKPLLGKEACVLGHQNLEKILECDNNEPSGYRISWDRFRDGTFLMYEILDNAIDQNEFTLRDIEETQKSNRKIGIGFMGLANMLYRLEIPYNSREGREFVDKLLSFWEEESDKASFAKAEKFGEFPNFKYSHHRNGPKKRNAIVRTLAPTGTTGFAAQTTGGMEPEYALTYTRETVQGTKINIFNQVLEEKLEKYPFFGNHDKKESLVDYLKEKGNGSLQGYTLTRDRNETDEDFKKRQENLDRIKKIFVTTYDISPEEHIRMQAVVQKHVDDAISKTTNFRNNAGVGDVERAFLLAYDLGIKGLTFYRDGTRKGQPLKVMRSEKEDGDLEKLSELVRRRLQRPRPEYVGGLTEKVITPYRIVEHGEEVVKMLNAFITVNWEKDADGRDIAPYEAFVDLGKAGGDLKAIGEGMGRAISTSLKLGAPIEHLIEQLEDIAGATQVGIGERRVKSLSDAIGKGLRQAVEKETRFNVAMNGNGISELKRKDRLSGNLCPNCHNPLIFGESCEKCTNRMCSYSKC